MSDVENSKTKVIGPSIDQVAYIPLTDVPPGYIPVVIDGERCHIHHNLVKQSETIHERFVGERRTRIEEISKTLFEVRPMPYSGWEESFRREPNPDLEIDTWFHIAMTYRQFDRSVKKLAAKKELLLLLIHCTMDTPERVKAAFKCNTLSGAMVAKVVGSFHEHYA